MLARHTIDIRSVILGLLPFSSVANRIAAAYRKHLFGDKTLQDLPDVPEFVLNAANVQTGALWQFWRKSMGDYRIGFAEQPTLSLASAVAASTAFPPFLSPAQLDVSKFKFKAVKARSDGEKNISDLHGKAPYNQNAVLSDGGVYDNLGLEPVFKTYRTILVSDGGQKIEDEPYPENDWARHAYRVMNLIDNQVRSLRKRILIDGYLNQLRKGAYWGIRTNIADYKLDDAMEGFPHLETLKLAAIPTRLQALPERDQERLIDWGYAVCDAALRKHFKSDGTIKPPLGLPSEKKAVERT